MKAKFTEVKQPKITLTFPGTKGEIEEESQLHKYHTSMILSTPQASILFDYGLKHNPSLDKKINEFDAIFITHSHPDHYIWTVKEPDKKISVPVYLTSVTYDYSIRKPDNYVIIETGSIYTVKDIKVQAFEVIHSLRCPAVCYRISCGKKLLYSPDIVDIKGGKDNVLDGLDLLIADGSSLNVNMVRNKDGQLFGHAMIKTIVNWCKKYSIPKLIITHAGKQIVSISYEEAEKKIIEYAGQELDFTIAYDGMSITVF
ncbi:MAG: MBL fold metallo-hydrolase [Actinobacteria bacterium]|nr:MBL fold metallo-hydrolase [Actinomycetota bacterium]